jgi:hypothetical protein
LGFPDYFLPLGGISVTHDVVFLLDWRLLWFLKQYRLLRRAVFAVVVPPSVKHERVGLHGYRTKTDSARLDSLER